MASQGYRLPENREDIWLPEGDTPQGEQDENFKYVHFAALPPLLFDLKKDPGQFVNRAADPAYAARLAEYSAKMLDWRLGFADRTLTGYRATPNGLEVRAA